MNIKSKFQLNRNKPVARLGVWLCAAVAAGCLFAEDITPYAKVTGTGNDDTRVSGGKFTVEPNTPYVFSCAMRHPVGDDTGVAVVIPARTSMYWHPKGNEWQVFTNAFLSVSDAAREECFLRQWHVPGDPEFRDVKLVKASPRYRRVGDLTLSFGESIDGNQYHYGTRFSSHAHGHSRPLVGYRHLSIDSTVTFTRRSELSFEHELAGRTFLTGRVGVAIDGGAKGAVCVSVSADGRDWVEMLAVSNIGVHHVAVPTALLPAKRLHVCVTGAPAAKAVKVRQYMFDAKVDGPAAFGFGETDYLDAANGATLLSLKPWDYLSDVTSGALLPGAPAGVACWSQSSGRKVFRGRPAPTAQDRALRIAAARNEAEAAQLVIRPEQAAKGVRVQANLPPFLETEIRRVGYLLVDLPMDSMGARGLWPDPIFDQEPAGCDIAAGENQPFWITVKPRKGTKPGLYKGMVEISATAGMKAFSVPVEVRVFGFDLPDRMTCETAFGLTFKTVFDYHHAVKAEDRKAIAAKYLEMFARHHITPYSPLYGMTAGTWTDKWSKPANPADATPTFSWKDWDDGVQKAMDVYHFNTFKLAVKGKGSGDPLSRAPRKARRINGASETNELYETYMARYLQAVESHIREKGWLDRAYIYSFDEPWKSDYDYMKEDLARFRKYAPLLRRMVTMAPCAEMEGYVNLWCPITERYDREKAWARQAAGDQVWWYITFSSKAPKVNEHVEHAGVDMRVWLWQTWLEKVTGVLIWETVCWNRSAVYPDPKKPQNPYEDTIVWARERPWNTGEGRYVYPPRRCFETKDPVIAGPVDSIRFEMLREGVEDYEYFAILKRLDPANAHLTVPRAVATSLDDYSTDPAAMEAHRLRLAEAIERLAVTRGTGANDSRRP